MNGEFLQGIKKRWNWSNR